MLDETTAELAKMHHSPILATTEASFKMRRPVPLHTTLRIECKVDPACQWLLLCWDWSPLCSTCAARADVPSYPSGSCLHRLLADLQLSADKQNPRHALLGHRHCVRSIRGGVGIL